MIQFLLQGGSTAPYISYLPVTVTGGREQARAAAPTADSSSSDLTDKDFLKMVDKLEGLPNDTDAVISLLKQFYIDQQYSLNSTTSNIELRYLSAVGQLNLLKFNRKLYDEAYDVVKNNGGLNELAIAGNKLIAIDNNMDVKYISPSDIKNIPEGYRLLTNSNLLSLRATNSLLVNNNQVLDLVKNGIGMESVTKMIKDSMINLGTTENKTEGYAKTDKNTLITSLLDFLKAAQNSGNYQATVDNLYKGSLLTKDLARQANEALQYIYNTLPENAKTLLKTKTSSGSDKDACELIGTLISSGLNTTNQFSIDMDSASSAKVDAKRKETGESDKLKQGLSVDVQAGMGGHDTLYTLDNATGIGMSIPGTYYEQIKNTEGKDLGRTSMQGMLGDSGLRSIINADNGVFFGDQKIELSDLKNITYDGNGLLRANLPIRSDGSPNFDLLDDFAKLQSDIEMGMDMQKALQKYPNLRELTDNNGNFRKDKFAPFIVASGMTTNGLININKDNKFITSKEPDDKLYQEIKLNLTEGTGKDAISPDIDTYDWTEWLMPDFINSYDNIYKGNIYIPINVNKRAAAYGDNQNLPISDANDLEQEYQQRDLTFNTGSASLLNN